MSTVTPSTDYPRETSLAFLERCSPRDASFYRYWDGKRNGRAMPSRADLDPIEMKQWLPGISLIDVAHNPRKLVYRLIGTKMMELRGRDVTGMTVEEGFIGSSLVDVLENYRLVIEEKKLVYDWDPLPSPDGWLREPEGLLLPLSSDRENVDMVIIYAEVEKR
ncbi:MAG: PAS domain-containing protein [Rhodospirillaceae bacterium]|nr:PAS domain-containing protein [Rhodospirillaceae bacterium]